jgi:hypothetical protein
VIARFASVCTCGCRRPYGAGAELVRGRAGWVLESCVDPRESPLPPSGSDAEVLDILRRARIVRDTGEAADRVRAARATGRLF